MAGVEAQGSLNNMITRGDDPRLKMMLAPVVADVTPEELGLEGAAAEGLRELEEYSPMSATFEKLDLARDGGSPELMASLAERIEQLFGSNPDLYNELMRSFGLKTEARMEMPGGEGVSGIFDAAAADTDRFLEGQDTTDDTQVENLVDASTRKNAAELEDGKVAGSYASLSVTAETEDSNQDFRRWISNRFNSLRTMGSGATLQGDEELESGDSTAWMMQQLNRPSGNVLSNFLQNRKGDPEAPPEDAPEPPPVETPEPEDAPPASEPGETPPAELESERELPIPEARGLYRPPSEPEVLPALELGVLEQGLEVLGSTKITMQPGEKYGEPLRGTSAEGLIGSQHRGMDLRIGAQGAPDPIHSPWEGAEVIGADYSESLGHWLALEDQDGTRWQLGHLEESATDRIGDSVRRGEYLATEGNSGKSSGYHLDLRLLEQEEQEKLDNADQDAFYRRLGESFGSPSESAGSREQVVRVVHEGLERIQVTGDLEPGAAGRLRRDLLRATQGLAENLTNISAPQNHHGFD